MDFHEQQYLSFNNDFDLLNYISLSIKQVVFVGYFGGTGHQPRYLGAGVASLGLGCFIMSMAHFTSPSYQPAAAGLTCNYNSRCMSPIHCYTPCCHLYIATPLAVIYTLLNSLLSAFHLNFTTRLEVSISSKRCYISCCHLDTTTLLAFI